MRAFHFRFGPSHDRQRGHDGQRMTDSTVRGTRDQYEQEQSRCSKYGHDSVRRDTARGKREQSHQDDSSQPKRQLQADHRREVILRSGPPVSLAKRSDGVDAAFQTCANRIREAPDVCPRSDNAHVPRSIHFQVRNAGIVSNTADAHKRETGRSVMTTARCAATVGSMARNAIAPSATPEPRALRVANPSATSSNAFNAHIAALERFCMKSGSLWR